MIIHILSSEISIVKCISATFATGVTLMICCVFELFLMVNVIGYVSLRSSFEFAKITLLGETWNAGVYGSNRWIDEYI